MRLQTVAPRWIAINEWNLSLALGNDLNSVDESVVGGNVLLRRDPYGRGRCVLCVGVVGVSVFVGVVCDSVTVGVAVVSVCGSGRRVYIF